MALHEGYATLNMVGLGKIHLILDASESAVQDQKAIVSLVQELLAGLPARSVGALYFLGNPSAYAPHHFASGSAQWFKDNQRRASLVAPMFESLGQDETSTVVIIGSGQIFDLDDWIGTPLMRRLLLVSVADSLQGGHRLPRRCFLRSPRMSFTGCMIRLSVWEISGPGFMPTWWNNAEYRLQITGRETALVSERLDDYAVTLASFAMRESEVQALATCASGAQHSEALGVVEREELPACDGGPLSAEELATFKRAIRQEPFTCPHCGRQHPWDTLRCMDGAILLGEVVYPSLQAADAAGFVMFRIVHSSVQFEIQPCSVLRLGSDVVADREGQRAVMYRYAARGEPWARGEPLSPYHPIGEGTYAILL